MRNSNVQKDRVPGQSESPQFVGELAHGSTFRRVFDCVCSAIALLLLSPVFCVIALAVKLDDHGPIFYYQERIGRQFRAFRLIKFRTMVVGADKDGLLTKHNDSRVTRVGTLLRRYKLDELPQLVNVLRGDMQFVGARPEVGRYVQIYRPEYALILQERPGITDPASLAYRHEERVLPHDETETVYVSRILPQKIHLSINYQKRRTFVSDLEILLTTVLELVRNS